LIGTPAPLPFLLEGWAFFVALAIFVGVGLALHAVFLRRLGAAGLDLWTRRIESVLFSIVLGTMLLLSFLQVILRNVFHTGVLWFDPFVRTLILWIAFLGAMVATSNARHLHIDVIRRSMSEKVSRWTGRFLSVIAAVCCGVLAHGASVYLEEQHLHGGSPFLGIPAWVAESILLWGFAMLCYRFCVQAIWPTVVRGPHDEGPSVMKKSSDIDAAIPTEGGAAGGKA
jgi:TRAP-type C4-dicarboxylate transport system permease small subunit